MTVKNTNKQTPYKVPARMKKKVRAFLGSFLEEHEISIPELVGRMHDKLGRSSSTSSMYDKFSRASFKLSEIMEILDLYGYELKIVPNRAIEGSESECNNLR